MAVKLYIFDESKFMLATNLDAVGYSLSDFKPPAGLVPDGPSNNPWKALGPDDEPIIQLQAAGLGYGWSFEVGSAAEARTLIDDFRNRARSIGRADISRVLGIDVTPSSMGLAERGQHWCSISGHGYHFGTRRLGRGLIAAGALGDKKLTGKGVKVFLVDQGVSQTYIEGLGGTYGGGMSWEVDGEVKFPGQGSSNNVRLPNQHGSMLMRSLIELAPDAHYYDLPMIPGRITDVESFTIKALFGFFFLRYVYLSQPGPWVILNAWGIVDRFAESLRGYYTNDPDHYLNHLVKLIAQKHDVVFAAGNSGQFCSDPRSTVYDRGPSRSIWGANGLSDVTSVGAVRTDGAWIGASSQGPGPEGFVTETETDTPKKPDLCAPSWFVENDNAHLRSGGTSSASAVVAGAIAALREGWDVSAVPPAEMRRALQDGARRVTSPGWNDRTGFGILNLKDTMTQLSA